jgi:hypothetical protein
MPKLNDAAFMLSEAIGNPFRTSRGYCRRTICWVDRKLLYHCGRGLSFKAVLSDLKQAGFSEFRMEPQYRTGGANAGGYTGTLNGKL